MTEARTLMHPPYTCTCQFSEGSLGWLCFLIHKIKKKNQKTSLQSASLASQVTASSPARFDSKDERDCKSQIFKSTPAVTREARLGDRKLVFRFSNENRFTIRHININSRRPLVSRVLFSSNIFLKLNNKS